MAFLTQKFLVNIPKDAHIVITKYKDRWFVTIRNDTMKRVHAVSNNYILQECITELETADMELKQIVLVKDSTNVISNSDFKKVMKKLWDEVVKDAAS